jgi:hypothetical protein
MAPKKQPPTPKQATATIAPATAQQPPSKSNPPQDQSTQESDSLEQSLGATDGFSALLDVMTGESDHSEHTVLEPVPNLIHVVNGKAYLSVGMSMEDAEALKWFIERGGRLVEVWARDTLLDKIPTPILEAVRSGAYTKHTLEGIYRGLSDGTIKWHQKLQPEISPSPTPPQYDARRALVDKRHAEDEVALREMELVKAEQAREDWEAKPKNVSHICEFCLAEYPPGHNAMSCYGTCGAAAWRGKMCHWPSLTASQCPHFRRKQTTRFR